MPFTWNARRIAALVAVIVIAILVWLSLNLGGTTR